jgi:hypothetical protein
VWIEPVVTIAAMARLHFEFGWPISCLGMQSKTWAFDLMGYKPTRLGSDGSCRRGKIEPAGIGRLLEKAFSLLCPRRT